MEGLTPSYRSQDMPALARSTDHARMLLGRAQLALAALAIALAVPVGLAVALTQQEPVTPVPMVLLEQPVVNSPALAAAAPMVSLWVGAATARGTSASVPVVSGPVPSLELRPAAAGVAAGVVTVAICWTLLLVAGAVWRSRLAADDARAWARDWARIEPVWSRRAG